MNAKNGNGKEQKPFKLKILVVSSIALASDLAWQLKKEGHDVKFCIEEKSCKDIADGFVEKVDKWKEWKDWADLIIFDDCLGYGRDAERLRKEGKMVVGGTVYTDRLEDDREFGQQEMEKVGINTLPHWDFTDFDEAIKFVKENSRRYVIKPNGEAANDKELLFVGREEDGKDVLLVLEHYKKNWAKKMKSFQLQKYAKGVEVAVGAYFNGKKFITPINVNFEHKKLFPGEKGPSTGEMGCYDEKTEVLTDEGWKSFKNLNYEDKICTLNPDNHIIEFHKPTRIVVFDHHKKLIRIKNRVLDIMVTPDHNMYVCSRYNTRSGKKKFEFVKARDLQYQCLIKRTGEWIGAEQNYFILPSVSIGHYEGRQVVFQQTPELQIPMDDWVAFMGIFLAEGSTSTGYRISVSQERGVKKQLIRKLLLKLPFNFRGSKNEFYCYNKQLYEFLKPFGKARDKHVPDFVKQLSPRQIMLFLNWYTLGDGTIMDGGWRIFYTSSKKMADDLQELLLKIGRVGTIKERKRKEKIFIVDHIAVSNGQHYEVHERLKKGDSWIDKRDTQVVDYNGKVYCATVKNHIMYVRRNGKPYWCGNTSMYWCEPNRIFNATLKKMEPKLAEVGYVGYVDINCIVNYYGIYPLEFTMRFGYPTINIHMEGILSPMGEFLYALAKGEDYPLRVKPGFQVGVVIAVPPFPFDDKRTFRKFSEDATIMFKKLNHDGIHIGDVKLVNDDWLVTGGIGYVLIVTGSGSTMKAARKTAYKRIDNIIIPNMFFRTDIGKRWDEDSDRLHTWGYLP